MPESFALVRLLNALFMGLEVKGFRSIGVLQTEAVQAAVKVNQALGLELLVAGGLIAFFLIVRITLSVEKPNPAQQLAEMIHGFTGSQADQTIGHGYERFQAFVTCIFLFVLINNLLGLIPGLGAPTSQPWVPLGLAVPTFLYYNYQGIRANGPIGYVKQLAGPVWWIAPLFFLIEIISHTARMMSLTIRLWANMYAGDLVTLGIFSLIPVVFPSVFMGFHIFVSFIQAYIFMLLAMIYLSMAVAHEH
jgi:F-type H+-transporting ATPase subunit a